MNLSANKNQDNAYSNKAKAMEFAKGCRTIETRCNAISSCANMFFALIIKLDVVFLKLVDEVKMVIHSYGTDYSTYPKDAPNIVAMALSVAKTIK